MSPTWRKFDWPIETLILPSWLVDRSLLEQRMFVRKSIEALWLVDACHVRPQGRDRKRSREASLVTVVVAVASEGVPFFWFFSFLLISLFRAFSFRSRLWQARKIRKWHGWRVARWHNPVTVPPWHVNTRVSRLVCEAPVRLSYIAKSSDGC